MYDTPEPSGCEAKNVTCEDDGIRARLVRNKQRAETNLKLINEALDALDKNPEVARVMELVRKAS